MNIKDIKDYFQVGYKMKEGVTLSIEEMKFVEGYIENLQDYLELVVGQSNQYPICKRYDFRELGHVSDCFMRTLPNGNVQYVGEDK